MGKNSASWFLIKKTIKDSDLINLDNLIKEKNV